MKKILQISFVLLLANLCRAQDSIVPIKKWKLAGYIKNLESISFDKNFNNAVSDNTIHNRLNCKWKPSEKITIAAEFRNRLVWGEEVKRLPGYAALLRNPNERFNLQKAWINNHSIVLHTNIDRLFFDYRDDRINFRVGRQRINWGITTTWNPNDIFNAYNFLDFDYEERPGADGMTFKYNFRNLSGFELGYSNTGTSRGDIAALKYSFNKSGYDVQFVTGWYRQHITVGAGWAGSIKDAGFKGEIQYFIQNKDSAGHLNAVLEADYMFKSGWYLNGSFLFNEKGLDKPVSNWQEIDLKLSPENLMPSKWNILVTAAREITPLLSVNTGMLYAPGTHLLILLPAVKYNIAANLDVNLVWQSFFAELSRNFEAVSHRGFLRLKWSF